MGSKRLWPFQVLQTDCRPADSSRSHPTRPVQSDNTESRDPIDLITSDTRFFRQDEFCLRVITLCDFLVTVGATL